MLNTENLDMDKNREIYPDPMQEPKQTDEKRVRTPRGLTRRKNFRPIILCFAFCLFALTNLSANLEGEISLGLGYSDNVFQLSDYDFQRFDDEHPNLDYVETTDDLTMSMRIDLAYPLHYRWWKFTPSVTGTISQNISNTDKQRQDAILRFRIDRHYWSFTSLYGYYPYIYYRHFNDSDGSDELEKYAYERNLYRTELVLRPHKNVTAFGNIRYEELYYNKYFTEADGDILTTELGARYSFPSFSLQGSYSYKDYQAEGWKDLQANDGSYQSNVFRGVLRLKAMPINGESTRKSSWQPYLELSREDRFYQANDSWYGGREYNSTNTKAGVNVKLSPKWNLSLDYLHIFRNVDSPNGSVLRLKEFSENRLSATVKYKF
ncbi:MAG: hypothetical protein PHC57_04845 [Candidatus Cloacimonetes bacterium]|nr:hypothetical protein [Candidatus Cloacimonadota bacterium]MDD4035075.1 hypothetical protein [Candidatus Cloacimonadota bacterium]MDD4666391.1 hypothetical protein [Candidatus Cloacimonadota bacterium]